MFSKLVTILMAAALLAACENPDQSLKISSKGGKLGGAPVSSGKPTGPGGTTPSEDQTPAEVIELLKIMTQAHQIFRETWFVATAEVLKQKGAKKEEPGSPFRRLGSLIDRHRHGHYEDVKREECNKYRTQITRSGDFKDKSHAFRLSFTAYAGCDDSVQNGETWASFEWAPNGSGSDQRHLTATFNREYLSAAFGSHVATRASLGQISKTAKCDIDFDAVLKIRKMECPGLAQNIDGASYFEFTSFSFANPPFDSDEDVSFTDDKTKETVVLVRKGDKLSVMAKGVLFATVAAKDWKSGDSGWTEGEKITTPVPPWGKIVQKIELLSVNAQDAYEQMKKDAEHDEPAAAPADTAKDGDKDKKESDGKAGGEQTGANSVDFGAAAQVAGAPATLVPGGQPIDPNAEARAQYEQAYDQAAQQYDSQEDAMNRSGFSTMTPEQQQQAQSDRQAQLAEYEAQRAEYQAQLAEYQARMAERGQQAQGQNQAANPAGVSANGQPAQEAEMAPADPMPAARRVMMPTHDPVTGGPVAGDYR